jgi:tetratricopeptide (TPR) repeat protein
MNCILLIAATLMTGLGNYHHPIHTSSALAQKFFDQGLNLYYGFNHDEAIRSFEQAAKLDPASPMPSWGKSLSLGRNYNRDEDPALEKAAYEALQHAQKLAVTAPQIEQDYVAALATRYSVDPKADHKALALAYKNAVCDLMRHYPDDLDAATFCAEAAMNLHPWQLWNHDGTPNEGTLELVAVLESVLRRDPLHPGANHYYIHAVEASPNPERALPSAERLGTLVPAAGHLVHMPAHIYIRTGDHDGAVAANEKAAAADRAYIASSHAMGMYPMMYYSHNLDFLYESNQMRGNYAGAKLAVDRLVANVTPGLKEMPMLEAFLPTAYFVEVRFHHWAAVMKIPAPDKSMKLSTAMWHFSRGFALAATGKTSQAADELRELQAVSKEVPADQLYGLNKASDVLALASAVLDARISQSIELWTKAVELQDALSYDEPPPWFYPVRESLGAALLAAGRPANAERVFREDLAKNPRNPRSLFGLAESLAAQKKTADEAWVRREFVIAWRHADTKLTGLL